MSAEQVAKVFVSYRRNDTKALSRLIYESLAAHFGDDRVFFDIDNIPIGVDFHEYLTEQVARCTVLLAIIGEDWTQADDAFGDSDFVAIEIRSALALGIPMIPIFAEGARPPRVEEVPPDIQPLLRTNGLEVDSGRDFRTHMEAVVRHAERLSRMHLAELAAAADAEAERLAREPSLGAGRTLQSLAPVTRSLPQLGAPATSVSPITLTAHVPGERPTVQSPPTPGGAGSGTAAGEEKTGVAPRTRRTLKRLLWLAPVTVAVGVALFALGGAFRPVASGPVLVRALDESGKPLIVAGARVSIDGQTCSTLPCTFGGLPLGAGRRLEISADGYEAAAIPVEVTREKQQVDVPLKAKRAVLDVKASRPGLELFVDGKKIGTLPQTVGKLRPGEHSVRVEARGFAAFEQSVQLEPGETFVLEPVLVLARRFARIELGKNAEGASVTLVSSRGSRPIERFPFELDLDLEESARLRAQKPGFVPVEIPVAFPSGAVDETFVIDFVHRAAVAPAATEQGKKRSDAPVRQGLASPGGKTAQKSAR